jgi:uncharacterized protein (DUF1015 family)
MLKAFRPLRYNPAAVGDLAAVVAPPYDVISDRDRDAFYERSEFNSVRLILNRDADRYGAAAALLRQWRADGVLVRDREPALCYYVENFEIGGVAYERTGLISAVRLQAFSEGHIRPHERTFARAKQDRMHLLRACRTNLSSIFGLVPGGPDLLAPARRESGRRPADIDLRQGNGWHHRVWLLRQPELIESIERAFADQTVFIADGHHRYETALEYRDERRLAASGDPDAGYEFIMMYLTSMHDPGLVVLPTHRILWNGAGIKPGQLLQRLKESFDVRTFNVSDTAGLRAALAQAPHGRAFGLAMVGIGERFLVTLTDAKLLERFAGNMAPAVRALDVTLLDAIVLRGLAGLDSTTAERSGRLTYVHDDIEALAAVDAGAEAVFLLAPPHLEDVEAVCLSGETMPQKSTYFFPKLLTGLVFNPLDDEPSNGTQDG